MKTEDRLALAYFKKFVVRVEILREFYKRKAYSDVIREGQEALELFNKALLRVMGITPSFTHDPGKELKEVQKSVPQEFQPFVDDLVRWSRTLRRERELSYYGAKDFIPTEEYTSDDALEVLEFMEKMSEILKSGLDRSLD